MSDFVEMRKEYERRLIAALYERLRVYLEQMSVMEDYIESLERQLSAVYFGRDKAGS